MKMKTSIIGSGKDAGQKSYKLGFSSHHTSLFNTRLAAWVNICVLSAKGADKEAACQSVISPVSSMPSEVRNTLERRVIEHISLALRHVWLLYIYCMTK